MNSAEGGYRLELTGSGTLYQYDADGVLRALPTSEIDVSRPFFSAPGNTDSDHDQGAVCDEDGHAPDAPVTDGRCSWCGDGVGEWVPLGYTTDPVEFTLDHVDLDRVEASGAAALRAEETARRVRPPAAAPFRLLRAAPPRWVTEQGPVGPPIPVYREDRPDGVYVQGSIGPAHPAYAALAEMASDLHVSVGPSGSDSLSDNGDSVKSRTGSVASPPVTTTGLGREHIARRAYVPPPQGIGLGDAVASLFGAELTGDPAEPVREIVTVRPNRADRRRAARGRRRG